MAGFAPWPLHDPAGELFGVNNETGMMVTPAPKTHKHRIQLLECAIPVAPPLSQKNMRFLIGQ